MLVALTWVVETSADPLGESALLEDVARGRDGGAAGWEAVSDATGTAPLLLVSLMGALALWFSGMRASAIFLAASVGLTALANPLVKALVGRERPDVVPIAEASSTSYPAGHAAASAALALAVTIVLTRLLDDRRAIAVGATAAALLVALVAASQLVLGRHHPSDLVAGWLLAAAIVLALSAMRGWLARRLEALAAARG